MGLVLFKVLIRYLPKAISVFERICDSGVVGKGTERLFRVLIEVLA